MKKTILIASLLFGITSLLSAQIFVGNDGTVTDRTKPATSKSIKKAKTISKGFDKSKLSFGGSLGLQFGDYTVVNVSPQVGYDVSKYFTLGGGLGYTYYKSKFYDHDNSYGYKSSYASFDLFARFYPVSSIVISVQPEISRMWRSVEARRTVDEYSESKFVPTLLIGGGLRLGGVIAMIQYDVIQNKDSQYGDGIFYTVGYSFGF